MAVGSPKESLALAAMGPLAPSYRVRVELPAALRRFAETDEGSVARRASRVAGTARNYERRGRSGFHLPRPGILRPEVL